MGGGLEPVSNRQVYIFLGPDARWEGQFII